jgi:hypothetical protein
MRELKMVADGSLKLIKEVETPPPPPPVAGTQPPPIEKMATGRSPTTEKMLDPSVFDNHLRVEMRNRGNGEGILGIPPRPSDMGASHSAPSTPNFRMDPVFGKYLATINQSQPSSSYLAHKHLPKLDFPKFNGENPKIWAKKCEVYFDAFSVPESLRTRYATLNFTDRAAPWLETV